MRTLILLATTWLSRLVASLAASLLLASSVSAQDIRPWMHSEVADAWGAGFKGQRTSITVVDDFSSWSRSAGILGDRSLVLRHGEWTRLEASMIAPSATMYSHDFRNSRAVTLRKGFNVVNLSYAIFAKDRLSGLRWNSRETSIIGFARSGSAVVVKAAGNNAVAVGAANAAGQVDYLNRALTGLPSAIFVGALSAHGSTSAPASLASYSNFAGSNLTVQNQFLVVGVEGDKTNLYGTSFAAPIVSGYAAIIASKFPSATPTQVANQLLTTARKDTVADYDASLHGRGEASLANALAPAAIR